MIQICTGAKKIIATTYYMWLLLLSFDYSFGNAMHNLIPFVRYIHIYKILDFDLTFATWNVGVSKSGSPSDMFRSFFLCLLLSDGTSTKIRFQWHKHLQK